MTDSPVDLARFTAAQDRYYSSTLAEHGATARGVDWNSPEAQELRFAQFLRLIDSTTPFSINDYGCGYGALAHYLLRLGLTFRYRGLDISAQMLEHARALNARPQDWEFVGRADELAPADYTVASGIFNLRLDFDDAAWRAYTLAILDEIDAVSRIGFAFNMLTIYSDPDRMRERLFYADPGFFFDRCKRRYAQNVALLHDYGAYEFTIIVRKEL